MNNSGPDRGPPVDPRQPQYQPPNQPYQPPNQPYAPPRQQGQYQPQYQPQYQQPYRPPMQPYGPPPPPPKPKGKGKIIAAVAIVVVMVLVVAGVFASGILNKKPADGNTAATIGLQGGSVRITDPGPLQGTSIEVPSGSNQAPVSFAVTAVDPPALSLPAGASVVGKMIHVETSGSSSWNAHKTFDMPLTVTLPYDGAAVAPGAIVRYYHYEPSTGALEAVGYFGENATTHTLTFKAATFSSFVAIQVLLQYFESLNSSATIDTNFRPATDGFFIPNYGSAMNPGGNCFGMVGFAKWYFANMKASTGVGLYSKYREGDLGQWRDDATALQLASRAQIMEGDVWSGLGPNEYSNATTMDTKQVGYSLIHGMIVSTEPQMIDLRVEYTNGTRANYGHVVMAYAYTNGKFNIYDPNVPGTAPGTGNQVMPFNTSVLAGFPDVFKSGLTANSPLMFNVFRHVNYRVFSPNNLFADLYASAEIGFIGDSKFPTVTLTDPNSVPSGTTPTDTDADHLRDTTDTKAVVSGSITGGGIAVTSTLVYVHGVKYETAVDAAGKFSIQVPLLPGENEVIILATDSTSFNKWAGWLKDAIMSTASPAAFSITMTWDQGSSDVDLHVLEPTINDTAGSHIYYNNKGYESGHPYLDFDNEYGYGPEHYIAEEGMTARNGGPGEPLFGIYEVKVHYYRDKDANTEETQGITWHIQIYYLAYKNIDTGDEVWMSEYYDGYLGVANLYGSNSFSSTGPEWSYVMEFEYKAPNPSDYGVSPPPTTAFT